MEFIFNPEIEEIAGLMSRVWEPPSWFYDVQTLDFYLGSKTNRVFSLGAYHKKALVGYLAYITQPAYFGELHRSIYSTFWTVDPKSSFRGMGLKLHQHMLTKVDINDYDSFLTVVDTNSTAQREILIIQNRVIKKYEQYKNYETYARDYGWLYTTPEILNRHVKEIRHGETEKVENINTSVVREIIVKCGNQVLQNVFTIEVLGDAFDKRVARVTCIYKKNGENIGIISGKMIKTVGIKIHPTLVVDLLIIDTMSEEEINEFIPSMGVYLATAGIGKIMIPSLGYYKEQPLLNAGFFRAKEKQTLYGFTKRPEMKKHSETAIYLDVF